MAKANEATNDAPEDQTDGKVQGEVIPVHIPAGDAMDDDALREAVKTNGDAIAAAMNEALATRIPPKGVAAAIEQIRTVDEDAQVLWTARGPRGMHVEELAYVLATFPPETKGERPIPRKVLVMAYVSGSFKVFDEADLAALLQPPF